MNSTFRAYLLPERPKLRAQKHRVGFPSVDTHMAIVNRQLKVQMERKIVELEDDMKEYWGFYLLRDSHYK